MFCVVSLVNCVLFTHIMKWEGMHLGTKHTLLLKLFDFCRFLAEISLLLSPALAGAVAFGKATFLGRKVKTSFQWRDQHYSALAVGCGAVDVGKRTSNKLLCSFQASSLFCVEDLMQKGEAHR